MDATKEKEIVEKMESILDAVGDEGESFLALIRGIVYSADTREVAEKWLRSLRRASRSSYASTTFKRGGSTLVR
jgi:hypothetical protein